MYINPCHRVLSVLPIPGTFIAGALVVLAGALARTGTDRTT